MKLPQPARVALGGLGVVLLFGLLGLAWWGHRRRSPRGTPARLSRVRSALLFGCLVLIAVGSVWRLVPVIEHVSACSLPGGVHTTTPRAHPTDASLVAEQAATWPETGIGLLYSAVRGAHVCLSRAADYLVAVNGDNVPGTKAMNMGDIVLTPGFNMSKERRTTLANHEARHRAQWAIATAMAGPFAFPVAYAVESFFFPGSRNLFERQAGLGSGGYRHVGLGPVLGPAQIGALVAVVALIAAAVGRRHLRAGRRMPGRHRRDRLSRAGPPRSV